MITPLEPQKFFKGIWKGEGLFRLHSIFHWFLPDQHVTYQGQTNWLTDTLWISNEKFQFANAAPATRVTYIQIVGSNRLHMTSDDIPGGANIILRENGFSFTPYLFRSPLAGGYLTAKCVDEVTLDENEILHDHIRMYYASICIASLNMSIKIGRDPLER